MTTNSTSTKAVLRSIGRRVAGPLVDRLYWRRLRRRAAILNSTDHSSVFSWIAYDPRRRVLTAKFARGGRYRYESVSRSVAREQFSSKSPGAFFNSDIRGQYPTWKAV